MTHSVLVRVSLVISIVALLTSSVLFTQRSIGTVNASTESQILVLGAKYPYRYFIPLIVNGAYGGYVSSVNFQVKSDMSTDIHLSILEPNGSVVTTRDYVLVGFGSAGVYLGDGTLPPDFAGSAVLESTFPLAVVIHTNGPSGLGTYMVPLDEIPE